MKTTIRVFFAGVLLFMSAAASVWAQADNEVKPPDQAVRIDNTGIHVGGEEPVDITLPKIGHDSGLLGPLLPIIAVLSVFGAPVAVVALFVFLRHRRNRMLHETLRAMVEKGAPIPPELIARGGITLGASNGMRPGYGDLRWGLVLIALGAGLYFMAGKIAFIPLFIGAALIAVWAIGAIADRRKKIVTS